MKKKKVKEIGITALYERLSRDDDGDGDSNSIVHQKQMLEAYAKEHGFVNLRHYTDDGWSGASFDRPAWNELVAGVKAEEITTVIVKDLSRVGRDPRYLPRWQPLHYWYSVCCILPVWPPSLLSAENWVENGPLQWYSGSVSWHGWQPSWYIVSAC